MTRSALPASIPAQRRSAPTLPRGIVGSSPDGRPWQLSTSGSGVVATLPSGTVAEARVTEIGELVDVQFWAEPTLSEELRANLVEQAFSHPALRPDRQVVVSVPRRDVDLMLMVRARLDQPRAHVAGATCLVEGLPRRA